MAATDGQNPLLDEITCGSLLHKLQVTYAFHISYCRRAWSTRQ